MYASYHRHHAGTCTKIEPFTANFSSLHRKFIETLQNIYDFLPGLWQTQGHQRKYIISPHAADGSGSLEGVLDIWSVASKDARPSSFRLPVLRMIP